MSQSDAPCNMCSTLFSAAKVAAQQLSRAGAGHWHDVIYVKVPIGACLMQHLAVVQLRGSALVECPIKFVHTGLHVAGNNL